LDLGAVPCQTRLTWFRDFVRYEGASGDWRLWHHFTKGLFNRPVKWFGLPDALESCGLLRITQVEATQTTPWRGTQDASPTVVGPASFDRCAWTEAALGLMQALGTWDAEGRSEYDKVEAVKAAEMRARVYQRVAEMPSDVRRVLERKCNRLPKAKAGLIIRAHYGAQGWRHIARVGAPATMGLVEASKIALLLRGQKIDE
jgi:hypothetical protein